MMEIYNLAEPKPERRVQSYLGHLTAKQAIFQRYPRPEKEYQSFSLIYNDRSLDLDPGDTEEVPRENIPQTRLGKAFSDIISYTAADKSSYQAESVPNSTLTSSPVDNSNGQNSGTEIFRVSLSSAVSSSSHGSGHDDFDAINDVFIWGEGIGNGMLGAGTRRVGLGNSYGSKMDALLPKALESKVVLDVHNIACGGRHAVLATRQGEIFSWGEESGGRLGHGVEVDVSHPKLIDTLSGMNIELVACGEYHTCAVTRSGDLYTWGDGTHNFGLLGHGSEVSHWIPKKVSGIMEGINVVSISCGPWHTAVVTAAGQLFTFGDGSFGVLGHGDCSSTSIPREVETLKGQRTTRVACGVWHTAAVVEVTDELSNSEPSGYSCSGKLFTWGDGDKCRLGHGDEESRLVPECVTALVNQSICQVACGYNLTVALTTLGQVYTMGSTAYGQLGSPEADGKLPSRVEGKISRSFVGEIACGSYHVAVLTSTAEVYTWGKGSNGQLGHGDNIHRNTPTLVNFLKDKLVKSVACGSNFTSVICLHKSVSSADHSICTGCHNPFGFRRKRHNCYNCGLVFCKACSNRKSLKASLAPNMNRPYRVCDDCYMKLKKALESGSILRPPKSKNGNMCHKSNEAIDKETRGNKLQTTLSRLSSFGSANQFETRRSKPDMKTELRDSRVFHTLNENFQFGGIYSIKASDSLVATSKKVSSTSLPGSRMGSRSTSPVSEKSSPARFSEEIFDYSKNRNGRLSQEIINLRAQVEDLTSKSQHLEAELERTSKQLKELKEMAERLPGHTTGYNEGSIAENTSNIQNQFSNESHAANGTISEAQSNRNLKDKTLRNGTKQPTGKGEWVVHDQPGVYITLSSLPGGGNELKRVRFSRKHFTEEQAEKWWAENGTKVCERHNILTS
ncbi:ph [Quercus suber]|uniref:Ph n=1 Tax=Quercus suber TaxID=58331 RepID=A0AAW0IRK4_QUESU